MEKREIIAVVGATASGKTDLAINLALEKNAEIISFDSRQFYKQISIGTAKPSEEELKKVKHHFISNVSIEQKYSVGEYQNQALELIEALFKENKNIVLVGGSGLYLKALEEGLDIFPEFEDNQSEELRNKLKDENIDNLQKLLKELDHNYFKQVDLNNPHRIIRAIEVSILSGKPYSSFIGKNKKERPFKIKKVAIDFDREVLYKRINNRVELMLENGLLKEVESLYNKKHLNALQTVGYKEFFDFIDGKLSFENAKQLVMQHTRNYAKRQITWFKADKNVIWIKQSDCKNIKQILF